MAKPKKFTTYLNNLLYSGAVSVIKRERGSPFGPHYKSIMLNARYDLRKWRIRIAATQVGRKYWGQKP